MYFLKSILILSVVIHFFAFSSHADLSAKSWAELSLDQKAELLLDLEYLDESDLPKDVSLINYLPSSSVKTEDLKVANSAHQNYIEKILQVFEDEVSREDIEQSEYSAYGDAEISELYLIVDANQNILAGFLGMYQDGRDQDGNDSDVNWQARVRFDANGEILKDERGQTYDELYFQWSGH